ncbi:MAG: 30S ribosomal protein S12 methylthiotransferase RimO [bacterium]|nr:30S ribosomal protein S12 methylthiotransferase RimO [bacterium]
MKLNIGLINLGCPKNLVDAETLLGFISLEKFTITDISNAQIAIVNTCCFIKEATKESLETILKLYQLKKTGRIKLILVTGCLPQRYKKDAFSELKEADAFIGPGKYSEINDIIESCLDSKREIRITSHPDYNISYRPVSLTPKHYTYLKISDGCSNKCHYCSIPSIRGPYRSKPWKDLKNELNFLSKNKNLKELNIIGQDITAYGNDLKTGMDLPYLLKNIIKETSVPWIRLLYTHPKHFKEELLDLINSERRVLRYIDLPLQHINDRILTKMNRGVTRNEISNLLDKIRDKTPQVAVRTTFIVGFPTETDKEFEELLDFVKLQKFDRLGAFKYSPEEGTKAFSFKPRVSESIQEERYHELMSAQKTISLEKNKKLIGQKINVLIDGASTKKNYSFYGRSGSDAPEIDNTVWIKKNKMKNENKIKIGNFYTIKITQAKHYDLVGEIVS